MASGILGTEYTEAAESPEDREAGGIRASERGVRAGFALGLPAVNAGRSLGLRVRTSLPPASTLPLTSAVAAAAVATNMAAAVISMTTTLVLTVISVSPGPRSVHEGVTSLLPRGVWEMEAVVVGCA